jgi:hypothetical protein
MEPLRPTRRTLTRTAVWSVPVVAVAATAPAYAASPCDCAAFSLPAFPQSGTSGTWSIVATGGGVSGTGTDEFANGSFVTNVDAPRGATRTVTASTSVCVVSGRTYSFSYTWTALTSNTRPMTSVFQIGGAPITLSTIDTSTSAISGSRNFTWTSNFSGSTTMAFVHTVTSPSGNIFNPNPSTTGDDITINRVTATCSGG